MRSRALTPIASRISASSRTDLRVDGGVVRADRLAADLPELAEAALLRALAAEVGAEVPELHRLRPLVHAVLEVGAADRRGALGAQRDALRVGLERVHLLLHDVGRLPHPAREQLGRLERGRLDPLVAGALEDRARLALERVARERLLAQHVVRAARCLDPAVHASCARNGLVARSRPIVVLPMWPGYTTVSPGSASTSMREAAHQRRRVAAGQVGAADRAGEQHVAGEHHLLGRDRVRDVARRVAGREDHLDRHARELEPLAAADGVVGVVGLVRAEARPRDVAHDVGEHRHLELRAPDLRAGCARDRRDRADVVEVRVREQDRGDLDLEPVDRLQQQRGLVAGVDHDRLRGAVEPGDVAVLLHRPDGEGADVHQRRFSRGGIGRPCLRMRRVQKKRSTW